MVNPVFHFKLLKYTIVFLICLPLSGRSSYNEQEMDIPTLQYTMRIMMNRDMDSCFKLLKEAERRVLIEKDPGLRKSLDIYIKLIRAKLSFSLGEKNKADSLANLVLEPLKETRDIPALCLAYSILSEASKVLEEKREYNSLSLQYAQQTSDDALIARTLFFNASTEFYAAIKREGDFQKVLEYTHSLSSHAGMTNDTLSLFLSNYMYGILYQHFKDYEKARSHLKKAGIYGSTYFDPIFHSGFLMKYGNLLWQLNDRENALRVFDHSLCSAIESNDICGSLRSYVWVGKILTNAGDTSAIEYFNRSADLASEYGITTFRYFLYLANMYYLTGDHGKAKENLDKFLSLKNVEKVMKKQTEYLKEVADLYYKLGEKDRAVEYYQKWGNTSDSLQQNTGRLQIAEMQRRYDIEKNKNHEITLQKAQLTESKQQQLWLGCVLLFVLAGGGSGMYYIKLRFHREKEQLRLNAKEAQLNQILIAQEEERKRLARELHDGVGQSLAALKMQLQMSENNKTSSETVESLDVLCKEVRSLSHQMMPMVLQENGLKEALEWLVDQCFSNSDIKADLVIHISENRLDHIMEVHLYRIAQELFNNTLKHSHATEIGIQLLQRQENLFLIIEDNGNGFNPEEKQSGMGLLNISSRLNSVAGKIEIQSGIGEGTFVRIVIPLVSSKSKMIA